MTQSLKEGDTIIYDPKGTLFEDCRIILQSGCTEQPSPGDLAVIDGIGHFISVKFTSGACKNERAIGFWYNEDFPFTLCETKSEVITPKNNDGRSECFWCQSKTKKVQSIFSVYSICTKCGR